MLFGFCTHFLSVFFQLLLSFVPFPIPPSLLLRKIQTNNDILRIIPHRSLLDTLTLNRRAIKATSGGWERRVRIRAKGAHVAHGAQGAQTAAGCNRSRDGGENLFAARARHVLERIYVCVGHKVSHSKGVRTQPEKKGGITKEPRLRDDIYSWLDLG